MTHVLTQESYILDCEYFHYSERSNFYAFYNCDEGSSVLLTQSEFIESLACSLMDEEEEETEVTQYHRDLAVNIFANSTRTGRAAFLYGMMP